MTLHLPLEVTMTDPGEGSLSSLHLFLDQNEARRAKRIFWETTPHPFSKGLDDRSPPFLSQGLDPALPSDCPC